MTPNSGPPGRSGVAPSTAHAAVGVAVLTAALYAITLATGRVNFYQWDNLETFLPGIWNAHTRLLDGSFPLWNPYQNLGEPLHAYGNGGVLYPVYTILVALVRLMDGPDVLVLQLSGVLHAAAASAAMVWLARECGARPAYAVVAGLALAGAGYNAVAGTLWVHVWPNLLWQLLAMVAVLRIARFGMSRGRLVGAAAAQAAPFLTGHIQTAAIAVLAVWTWTVLLLIVIPAARRHALPLLGAALAGPLLAAPANLPTVAALSGSARIAASVLDAVPLRPQALLGMFAAPVSIWPGFMQQATALAVFTGAWVPVVFIAAALRGRSGGRPRGAEPSDDAGADLGVHVAAAAAAAVMIVLSFGDVAGLYLALRQLPLWSHTRWSFKFLAPAVPLLVLSGALILDRLVRQDAIHALRVAACVAAVIAAAAIVIAPPAGTLAWIGVILCFIQIASMAAGPRTAGFALAVTSALLLPIVLLLARPVDHPKSYFAERAPGFSAAQLDVLRQARVLPLSVSAPAPQRVRALGTFYSAMLDGYTSASGQRFALSPRRIEELLPANYDGVPFIRASRRVLVTDWPFVAGVGFLIVRRDDDERHAVVTETRPDATVAFATEHAVVYSIEEPAGPVLLLDARLVHDSLPGAGSLPRDIATRGGVERVTGAMPELDVRVRAAEPAVVVVSTLLSQELVVRVNGTRVQPRPVYAGLLGIDVPAGTHHIAIRVRRWPLLAGFGIAAIALLALIGAGAPRRARISS